jgi:hypothetical protein
VFVAVMARTAGLTAEGDRSMLEAVVLTSEEQKLWDGIPFRIDWRTGGPLATPGSMEAARTLTMSLLEREAIPRVRLSYFTDPELNVRGHGRSRKQIFERNGTRGENIFRHPHFFRYLRYFVLGPDLPGETVRRFAEAAADDEDGLQAFAREEVRRRGLERTDAAEEFFKLALELDLDPWIARGVRDAVMRLKSR